MAPHSSTLDWKIPLDGGAWWAAVHGVAKSWTQLSTHATSHFHIRCIFKMELVKTHRNQKLMHN